VSPKQDEGFRGISLKKELVDDVEKFIKEYPEVGYKNIAEFVSDAVRRRKEQLIQTYAVKPQGEA
jgi:metal-responsive CopG/Arc/MetJ family transcriptional regulator